jgi:hypothetical protein
MTTPPSPAPGKDQAAQPNPNPGGGAPHAAAPPPDAGSGPGQQATPGGGANQGGAGTPTPQSSTTAPDPARVKQVDSAEQLWANRQTNVQAERARKREDMLSAQVTHADRMGDLVSGDKIVNVTVPGFHRETASAYRVRADVLERPYVPTTKFEALQVATGSSRLVVVRGRPGIGKFAALLNCMADGRGDVVVIQLSGETDLRRLDPAQLPRCSAIVLENLTQDHVGQLAATVDGLAGALQPDCWLGFTVTGELPLPRALDEVVVDIGEPPSAREVFEKHLSAGAPDREMFGHIVAKVAPRLAGSSLSRAALLARNLADIASIDEVDAIVQRWSDLPPEHVQWFNSLPDVRAHCMAVALAVFDGLPREEVSGAAEQLVARIGLRGRARQANPFTSDTGVPLQTLRAETAPGTISVYEGDLPMTVLRYEDGAYPWLVLEHVWNELDTARPHLVSWLRDLGGHHNPDVRTAAAVAVGVLARNSFDHLYAQIIGSWADAPEMVRRESATFALGPLLRDDRLRRTVDEIVEGWVTNNEQPLTQATAARAFGTETGRARFLRSMRMLAVLAEVEHIDVAIAVAMTLGDFVLHGTTVMTGRVLDDIRGWVRGRKYWPRLAGRLAFLRLTYLRAEPVPDGTPDGVQQNPKLRSVPTLLILASQDQRIAEGVVELWADSLNAAESTYKMRASLARWAATVDGHRAARAVLAEVVRHIALDPRVATIIRREPALADLL